MKKLLLLTLIASLATVACKKDKMNSKPELTFLSYSTSQITQGMPGMLMTFNVKDGDGDIEQNMNFKIILKNKFGTDTIPIDKYEKRQLPGLESNKGRKLDAEIQMTVFAEDLSLAHTGGPWDSLHFRIFIDDNAGNSSDTIATPKLFIRN